MKLASALLLIADAHPVLAASFGFAVTYLPFGVWALWRVI